MTSLNSALTVLDLFSGIGGFSYAAERLVGGFKTIAFCDSDEPCRKVLRKHWPSTPIFEDVRTLTAKEIKPFCPDGLSLITAGFPCQDLSVAGKQAGYDGERSVLFYEIIRLARELRPNFLLLENVRNLLSHRGGETFQETLFQIAKAGYDAEWAVIPASDVGACHRRERIWIIAHAQSSGRRTRAGQGESQAGRQEPRAGDCGTGSDAADTPHLLSDGSTAGHAGELEVRTIPESGDGGGAANAADSNGQRQQKKQPAAIADRTGWPCWRNASRPLNPNWRSYASQPVLCRGDDGLRGRVDRLKQLGNSIVPQVAAVPLQRIKDVALGATQW